MGRGAAVGPVWHCAAAVPQPPQPGREAAGAAADPQLGQGAGRRWPAQHLRITMWVALLLQSVHRLMLPHMYVWQPRAPVSRSHQLMTSTSHTMACLHTVTMSLLQSPLTPLLQLLLSRPPSGCTDRLWCCRSRRRQAGRGPAGRAGQPGLQRAPAPEEGHRVGAAHWGTHSSQAATSAASG
jgi:hypothetical protein